MRFFREWWDRFWRRLALAKRRLLGPPSLIFDASDSSEAAIHPKPPHGSAPRTGEDGSGGAVPGRSYLDLFRKSEDEADHPVLGQLRSRAVNEMFGWLGLTLIPRQIWPILETVRDPGLAVEQIIVGLGCDPKRARRRDAVEIERLQSAIDILVALDTLRPHLSLTHLAEIELLLFSGKHDTVGRYHRIVSALSGVLIGREKSASLRVFQAYNTFIAEIERYIRDPLRLEPEDAEDALRLSDVFTTSMEDYAVLHDKISRVIGAVLANWPEEFESGDEFDIRNGIILRFEEIDTSLLNEKDLNLADIKALIEECSLLLRDVEELLHRIRADPGPDSAAGMSEMDAALAFFGFGEGASPSWEEIQKAFREIMKRVHTDLAAGITDPEEIARREELSRKANIHRDLLRRRWHGAS